MFLPPPIFGFTAALKLGARQMFAAQVVARAIAEAGLSRKEAADQCDLTEPQLSAQLCEHGDTVLAHFSVQRLVQMTPAVIASVGRQLFEEFSGGVCLEKPEIVRIVTTNQRIVDRLMEMDDELCELRQQVRMELPEAVETRKRA